MISAAPPTNGPARLCWPTTRTKGGSCAFVGASTRSFLLAARRKTPRWTRILVASRLAPDAVLAYHTALSFHGRAHSVAERFVFLTATRSRPLAFRTWQFRPVSFTKALCRAHEEFFAVQETERSGLPVRVTTLERTLVDVLDRPDLGGGWEEIWRSLGTVEFFNLDRVIEYATLMDNATTAAKVGFFPGTASGSAYGRREPLGKIDGAAAQRAALPGTHRQDRAEVGRQMESGGSGGLDRTSLGAGAMKISRQQLAKDAKASGYRPEILEKVFYLLNLLSGFQSHPFSKDRLALKGGTALNLFQFDVPRLSVDIDLNYVGAADREVMLQERPKVEQAVQAVCRPGGHDGHSHAVGSCRREMATPLCFGRQRDGDAGGGPQLHVSRSAVACGAAGFAACGLVSGIGHPGARSARVGCGQTGGVARPPCQP